MAKQFAAFENDHRAFVAEQPVFFVASSAPGARLNLTGPGNETAARLPDLPGARQIVDMSVALVPSSCGDAVPRLDAAQERPVLRHWAKDRGHEGLRGFWRARNGARIDGRPIGIEGNLP